jgi:murein L,D-transpeptidase YcbB/YkuD
MRYILYSFLIFLTFLAGCGKNEEKTNEAMANITRHALDSLKTTNFFADRDIRTYLKEEFEKFYQNRQYQPAWVSERGLRSDGKSFLETLEQASNEGLQPEDYGVNEIRALEKKIFEDKAFKGDTRLARMVELDFRMTSNYLMYASHLLSGRINPQKLHAEWKFTPRKKDLVAHLEEALQGSDVGASLNGLLPENREYTELRDKLAQYRKVAAAGGWPEVPAQLKLKKGASGEAVALLKRRLMLSGDLDSTGLRRPLQAGMAVDNPTPATDVYDEQVETALKAFQERHGQNPTGQLDAGTLSALNVPAAYRVKQIALNMERIRWQPDTLKDERYIIVNVPEFKLRLMENARAAMDMRVIVGKEFNSTPIFSDTIEYLVFSPDWTVPNSIIENEIMPKLVKDSGHLDKLGLQVYSSWNDKDTIPMDPHDVDWASIDPAKFPYRVVQKPGPKNPLGLVKFDMPNKMSIYLHDTPSDHLFAKEQRGMSHGCVRVEKPLDLAKYLIKDNPPVTDEELNEWMHQPKPKRVKLAKKVPVRLTYLTAWVDEQGRVNFREDIYEHDKVQMNAIVRKEKSLN